MAGLLERGAMGDLILFASGLVALCAVLWLLGRGLRKPRPVESDPSVTEAIAAVPSVAPVALPRGGAPVRIDGGRTEPPAAVPSEPVVLFRTYPAVEPAVVPKDIVPAAKPIVVQERPVERAPEPVVRHTVEAKPKTVVAAPVPPDAVVVAAPVADAAASVALEAEPVTPPPVRRRPRPAWELAVDGQTPASLLARAHEHLAAGAHDEAATQLRACARLASKLKEVGIEAVARLELGDLAQVHGDMTTACEHWQLARSLYAELKRADEATGAEKRMEKAGCPTDWVLTKF